MYGIHIMKTLRDHNIEVCIYSEDSCLIKLHLVVIDLHGYTQSLSLSCQSLQRHTTPLKNS